MNFSVALSSLNLKSEGKFRPQMRRICNQNIDDDGDCYSWLRRYHWKRAYVPTKRVFVVKGGSQILNKHYLLAAALRIGTDDLA